MEHLTIDDMIRFVSLTELNSEAIEVLTKVNGHIRECQKCLELVDAFQTVHNEFMRMRRNGDYRDYLKALVSDNAKNNEAEKIVVNCFDDLEL